MTWGAAGGWTSLAYRHRPCCAESLHGPYPSASLARTRQLAAPSGTVSGTFQENAAPLGLAEVSRRRRLGVPEPSGSQLTSNWALTGSPSGSVSVARRVGETRTWAGVARSQGRPSVVRPLGEGRSGTCAAAGRGVAASSPAARAVIRTRTVVLGTVRLPGPLGAGPAPPSAQHLPPAPTVAGPWHARLSFCAPVLIGGAFRARRCHRATSSPGDAARCATQGEGKCGPSRPR